MKLTSSNSWTSKRQITLSLLVLSTLSSLAHGQCDLSSSEITSLSDTVSLRHGVQSDASTVTVELTYSGQGWLGFGFVDQPVMVPNNAIVALPSSNSVQWYGLTSESNAGVTPLSSDLQTLTDATITQNDTHTVLTFTQPLTYESADGGSLSLSSGSTTSYIYAVGSSNELNIHSSRGTGSIALADCPTSGSSSGGGGDTTSAPVASPVAIPATATDSPFAAPTAGTPISGILQQTVNFNSDTVAVLTTDTSAGTIKVEMTYAGIGYIAFGFSPDGTMIDALAVIAVPDAATGVPVKYDMTDRTLSGVVEAPASRQTLQDASYSQNSTHTTMTFTKYLVEADEPAVIVATAQSNFFLYAVGGSNTLDQHIARGAASVNLAEGQAVAATSDNQKLWKAHGWCMAIAWAILVPMAILSSVARNFVMPLREGAWFQIHRALNVLGLLLTVAGFAIAVYLIRDEQGETEFGESQHRTIGLIVFIFAVVQSMTGIFRPHLHAHDDEKEGANGTTANGGVSAPQKSIFRVVWEYQHRLLGVTTIILAWINLSSGIDEYNSRYNGKDLAGALWGVIFGITGLTVVLAILERIRKGQESQDSSRNEPSSTSAA